jgi:gluconolactonase
MDVTAFSPKLSEVLPAGAAPERVATGFGFTEGPLWDPRTRSLLFSDIPNDRILEWSEAGGTRVCREPSGKSNGLTWDREGRLLACEHLNRRVSRTLPDGTVATVADQCRGKRLNSPNDLVMRSDGTIYFSDPPYGIQSESMGALAEQEQPLNGLYLVRPGESEPALLAVDFDRPNGLAFSPDEQLLYVNDTPRYHTRVFRVRPDGTLDGGEVFAEFDRERGDGRPDGMKVDARGIVYTTGPGGLWIVSPAGEILGHVRFPEKTANCAWGDDDLRSLFVCASTSIYRLRTLVEGIPALHRQ